MDKEDKKEWYFAYGSNLCVEQMARRTGAVGEGQDAPRIARLPGYRLAFNMQGNDGSVYANIVQPGDGVIGVLYRCGAAALAKLDVYEEGYDRRRVLTTLENGETQEATAYVAKPGRVEEGRRPSDAYLQIILRGARRHGLPDAYIHSIEGAGPKRSRHLRRRHTSLKRNSFLHHAAQVVDRASSLSLVRTSFAWTHRRTRRWVRTHDGRPLSPPPQLVRFPKRRSTSDRSFKSPRAKSGKGPSVNAIERSRPAVCFL